MWSIAIIRTGRIVGSRDCKALVISRTTGIRQLTHHPAIRLLVILSNRVAIIPCLAWATEKAPQRVPRLGISRENGPGLIEYRKLGVDPLNYVVRSDGHV